VFSLTSVLQVFDSLKYIDRDVWSSCQHAFEKKIVTSYIGSRKKILLFCSNVEMRGKHNLLAVFHWTVCSISFIILLFMIYCDRKTEEENTSIK